MLNIEIGKTYQAVFLLKEIENYKSNQGEVKIGHASVERFEFVKKIKVVKEVHEYDLGIKQLKELNTTKLKVLSIINPCEQNFAYKLLNLNETKEILKDVITKKNVSCVFSMDEMINAGYGSKTKSLKQAIKCFNDVIEKEGLPLRATEWSQPSFVQLVYKNM